MEKLIDARPDVAKDWHPTKNKPLTPAEVSRGSRVKVWWKGACGHEYQCRIEFRTRSKNPCGCPYCRRGKLTGTAADTHPHLILEWHEKNEFSLTDVTAGSVRLVWWKGICGHEWQATLRNRSKPTKPSGCPFCANRSVNETNSLSRRCPDVASEWHPTKNDITPDNINYRSYKKVHWLGVCGHEWETMVRTRTREIRPAGCPLCQDSKGEKLIESTLKNLGVAYEKQMRFSTCRDKKPLPFDFRVGRVLIEYQGAQHYQPTNFGGDYLQEFHDIQRRDKIKRDWCVANGYRLIEVPYTKYDTIPDIIQGIIYVPPSD